MNGPLGKHYLIKLFVKDIDSSVNGVEYALDPTYVRSKRVVWKDDETPLCDLLISSYGNYEIKAMSLTGTKSSRSPQVLIAPLTQALARGMEEKLQRVLAEANQAELTKVKAEVAEMRRSIETAIAEIGTK